MYKNLQLFQDLTLPITTTNFGLTERPKTYAGNISGYVYDDSNQNGIQDTGEKFMAGWKICIDLNKKDLNRFYKRQKLLKMFLSFLFSNFTAMKEMKVHFLLLFMVFFLFSCFGGSSDEVIDAKKGMGIITQNNNGIDNGDNLGTYTGDLLNDLPDNTSSGTIKENKPIEISYLTDNKFLELDDLSGKNLLGGEVEITGKTLTNVDKIIIKFSNKTSDYPDDNFTLKQYKAGDKTFLYRAFSRYETLDFGRNEYIIESYSGAEVSKLLLIINVEKEKELGKIDLIDIKNLPTGGSFGDPKELGDGKITYSDLKGLEIKKVDDDFFGCDINVETDNYYISEYLDKITDSYYWWNTCRPFPINGTGEKDNGISYFVLRLDGVGYKYEKHIFLKNGIYGMYELESGDNLVLEEDSVQEKNAKLKIKNDELKEKNSEYNNLDIVDSLFKKLIDN